MNPKVPIAGRIRCPCCGYPTLSEAAAYEICELCNWEDDGQGDEEADEVWGGPNSDYSLAEARANFKRHRVMYAPVRDKRITPGDSALEFETKGQLMEAFAKLAHASLEEKNGIEFEIARLEQVIEDELHRTVREYEARHRGEA
jgi:hypothetical protein